MEVRLVNLTKEFSKKEGNVVAVDHINIDIPSGKLIGLLGPSGCGKSTTLYMIAGLHRPTDGEIYFDEKEVSKYPPDKRGIGLVFQNYALYPHLTVGQNIMFPLLSRKEPKKQAYEKALEMAKLVGIENLMDRLPSQLSGGQQQRVAIARALVKMPEVLLLDEPLSNLDARLRLQTREEIKRIQRETGITTIFVTHDQEEAMSISDEIVVMKLGVVQQIGAPQYVYDNPANEFVARFLGTPPINIIDATIENGKAYMFGQEVVGDYVLPMAEKAAEETAEATEQTKVATTVANGDTLHIGIRPEFIRVNPNGNYSIEIEFVEYIGRDKTIIFRLEGCDKTFKGIIPAEVNVNPGEKVKVSLTKFFIFTEDGERLY